MTQIGERERERREPRSFIMYTPHNYGFKSNTPYVWLYKPYNIYIYGVVIGIMFSHNAHGSSYSRAVFCPIALCICTTKNMNYWSISFLLVNSFSLTGQTLIPYDSLSHTHTYTFYIPSLLALIRFSALLFPHRNL